MVFGLITDTVDAILDTASDIFDSLIDEDEEPNRENVERLIDAGLTIAAISDGFGVAESVIEILMD